MHCSSCSPSRSPRYLTKRLRNLRKKLREIAFLERCGKDCGALPAEVQQKLTRRSLLEGEIANLVATLVVAQEGKSVSSQDEVAFALDGQQEKKISVGPSVWLEQATATPDTATSVHSNRSISQSDSDKANSVECSGNLSCQENRGSANQSLASHSLDRSGLEARTVGASPSHPSLIDVEVSIGKASTCFRVPEHFQLMKGLGSGSYGSVAAFWDMKNNERVAVKKVANVFSELPSGKRALREIRVLNSMHHNNIVKMFYYYCDRRSSHDDLYIIQERVDIDLHVVIRRSGQLLTEKHHRHILYGITRGLAYLHDMDVAHRDLKPANILVNTDCSVKICDFNLSRGGLLSLCGNPCQHSFADDAELSEYVCTRWYRAPELMLFKGRYGKSVDVWSLGCIVCELLSSKPVFKGANTADQIRQIINTIGYPLKEELDGRTFHSGVQRVLRPLINVRGKPWHVVLPGSSCEALNMITQLLKFGPEKRTTAKECLRQAYFFKIHRQSHEDCATSAMDWSFDDPGSTRACLRELLCGEGCAFVEVDTSSPSLPKMIPRGMSWADVEDD